MGPNSRATARIRAELERLLLRLDKPVQSPGVGPLAPPVPRVQIPVSDEHPGDVVVTVRGPGGEDIVCVPCTANFITRGPNPSE